MKRQAIEWEKIFANYISYKKDLFLEYIKYSQNSTARKQTNFSNQCFHFFFQKYTQERKRWTIRQSYFQFFEETPHRFPQWLHQFTSSASSPMFITWSHVDRCEVTFHCCSDLHFSNNQQSEYLFNVSSSYTHIFFGEKYLFRSCAHFLIGLFGFFILNHTSCFTAALLIIARYRSNPSVHQY